MNQIVMISPLDAIEIFKQLGFETLVSNDAPTILAFIKKHIQEVKVFIYDLSLKDVMASLVNEYKSQAFPIFVALAFQEEHIEASIAEANRQIETAIGIKIE